jgi:hypothetical protein
MTFVVVVVKNDSCSFYNVEVGCMKIVLSFKISASINKLDAKKKLLVEVPLKILDSLCVEM